MDKKICIRSFGCQMNKLDTAMVTAALKEKGCSFVDDEKIADAVIFNTCSVREHAETKVMGHLGHMKYIRNSKPLVVAVIGCMAQRLGDELLSHKAVDIVCGPAQISHLADMLKDVFDKHEKKLAVTSDIRKSDPENTELEDFESVYDSDDKDIPGQAFVRAMRGCDNFCTYCIVPYVRGPEVSRSPQAIIEQVKRLGDEGIKIVTLIGQTVNSYEYKAGEKTYCLADLFEMASEVEGIEWIRFVTNYPQKKYFEEICNAIARLPKVSPYLHMPPQSGSDRILKAMNRHYTSSEYLELLDIARQIVPDIAIAGDFIVGFPGETDDDFQRSARLVEKVQYRNCFVFKYSPRPGTHSERKLIDDVPVEVKKQRNNELLKIQQDIGLKLAKQMVGKKVYVLVEGLSKKPHLNKDQSNNNPQLVSRTADDWIVVFNGPVSLTGNFVTVKITRALPLTLFGEL